MKALSLWNPYAMLIALMAKMYETRHWPTKYRGLLAIHAATRWTPDLREFTFQVGEKYPHLQEGMARLDWSQSARGNPYFGSMLCIVRLVDVISTNHLPEHLISRQEANFGNYEPNRFAWKLEMVEVFEKPIPARGFQRLWNWERPAT